MITGELEPQLVCVWMPVFLCGNLVHTDEDSDVVVVDVWSNKVWR